METQLRIELKTLGASLGNLCFGPHQMFAYNFGTEMKTSTCFSHMIMLNISSSFPLKLFTGLSCIVHMASLRSLFFIVYMSTPYTYIIPERCTCGFGQLLVQEVDFTSYLAALVILFHAGVRFQTYARALFITKRMKGARFVPILAPTQGILPYKINLFSMDVFRGKLSDLVDHSRIGIKYTVYGVTWANCPTARGAAMNLQGSSLSSTSDVTVSYKIILKRRNGVAHSLAKAVKLNEVDNLLGENGSPVQRPITPSSTTSFTVLCL